MRPPKTTAILLINLGTPKSPSVSNVRTYLREFLNDNRVIDVWAVRWFIMNLIVIPFRAFSSAKIYKKLWTKEGSPLLIYGKRLQEKLQKRVPKHHKVFLAMRYGQPSLDLILEEIRHYNPDDITILPLFPQYASASTGSAVEKTMRIISKWQAIPNLNFINQFYDKPGFNKLYADIAIKYNPKSYDHIIFSFHGLPERQVDKVYLKGKCQDKDCETSISEENKWCYKATCFETAKQIASHLNLSPEDYTVAFQSRLGGGWLEPFSDKIVEERAKKGDKKLLMFSPAFIADCLETTIEIGEEYQEIFEEHGGEKVQLVESLNDSEPWVDFVEQLVIKKG